MFSGVFELTSWGYAIVALVLTHATIVAVTVFLHRHQTHRALDLHPAVSHAFRLWLWLTTGMVTKEWVAVHRKHPAKCETPLDPHSPRILGINRVLWAGVFFYVKEARQAGTLERYGAGTPEDWLERNVYSRWPFLGVSLMGVVDVALLGVAPGALIFLVQMVWIPFWAAGVINGVGHHCGYRNWATPDASTNIMPFGLLIGGEELHNNHHAYPTSAKLSNKWYEVDIGWLYIRILEGLGLARVKYSTPTPRQTTAKPAVDVELLQTLVACRYDVLAKYAKSLDHTYRQELARLRKFAPQDARTLSALKPWLHRDDAMLRESERIKLAETLPKAQALHMMYSMRSELVAIWGRSMATQHQLVKQLRDWCQRAEASSIGELRHFSRQLRSYAALSEGRASTSDLRRSALASRDEGFSPLGRVASERERRLQPHRKATDMFD
jgi:stearoyl-CoA desaturase (delta-9 desaturase)